MLMGGWGEYPHGHSLKHADGKVRTDLPAAFTDYLCSEDTQKKQSSSWQLYHDCTAGLDPCPVPVYIEGE